MKIMQKSNLVLVIFTMGFIFLFMCLYLNKMNYETIVSDQLIRQNEVYILSTAPRLKNDYDIGNQIDITSNGIWAIGGWNSTSDSLFYSASDGQTWEKIKLPVDNVSVSGDVSFSDSQNGWVVSWLRMIKTIDGGKSWENIQLPEESKITSLQTVKFFDSQNGFVGGTINRMNKQTGEALLGIEILCSQDGGKKWEICYKSSKHNTIFQMLILSEKTMAVFVDGDYLLLTENYGETWREIELLNKGMSICNDTNKTLWLVGDNNTFLYSKNEGQTWSQIDPFYKNNYEFNWRSIDFNKNGVGIAVGAAGVIAITKDYGLTWSMQNIAKENLQNVRIRDSLILVLGEKNLYRLSL